MRGVWYRIIVVWVVVGMLVGCGEGGTYQTSVPVSPLPTRQSLVAQPSVETIANDLSQMSLPSDEIFDFRLEKGSLRILAKQGGYSQISFLKGETIQDGRIEVDATFVSVPAVGGELGTAFRWTEGNHYLCSISSQGGFAVRKYDGKWTVLAEQKTSVAIKSQEGARNHLAVEFVGEEISFFVNGELLVQLKDATFTQGEVGLSIVGRREGSGLEIKYENLLVQEYPVQPIQKVEAANLTGIALGEFSENQYTVLDANKDGQADGVSWQSQAIEVVPGLLVQKKLTLQKDKPSAPDDANCTLDWQVVFQNTTKSDITYTHREYIPKTIAKSARDIKFYDSRGKERPPDKIISDDPITEWIMVIKAETIDKIVAKIPGLQSYPANPISILDGMTHAERCAWIAKHLKPHMPLMIEEAKKQGVPDWLAALAFTNELMDISAIDMIQPYVPNPGSTGIAQINVILAYDKKIFADQTEYQKRMAQILANMQQDVIVRDWSKETKERTAGLYVCWEMLANPRWAVFAGAKRVRQIIDEANNNLDVPFCKLLLSGPIDLGDPLKNVKTQVSLLGKSEGEKLILRRQALATLVIAAYNTDTIVIDEYATHIHNPYETLEDGENYYNAMAHARNGRDALLALMNCGYFVDPKKPIPDTSAPPPKNENTPVIKPTLGPTKAPVPVKTNTPAPVDELTRCRNMPRWQGRQSCLRNYGIATRNLSICEEIEVQEQYRGSLQFDDKDLCYIGIAKALLDAGPCKDVVNKSNRGWCREYVAVNSENPPLCKLIMAEEDTWQTRDIHDACYRSLANRLNQPSLCENILNGISRSYCYRSFTEK